MAKSKQPIHKMQSAEAQLSGGGVPKGGPTAKAQSAQAKARNAAKASVAKLQSKVGNVRKDSPVAKAQSAVNKPKP